MSQLIVAMMNVFFSFSRNEFVFDAWRPTYDDDSNAYRAHKKVLFEVILIISLEEICCSVAGLNYTSCCCL